MIIITLVRKHCFSLYTRQRSVNEVITKKHVYAVYFNEYIKFDIVQETRYIKKNQKIQIKHS